MQHDKDNSDDSDDNPVAYNISNISIKITDIVLIMSS